ncbi:phosphoserine phosphatase [Sphingomonas jejuensis]|uniref:Phosphoserine phosphatase n=1 Tax=Sphingomonas jejuensis TaxID=904715 RepID=A0ABX0XK66_9SPHN|nr:phosphoserine phosphatase SerB [Sphingomonas jejuensis]NJC33234.1 phosphoserine phosphatase [Sphingomonas jejuensis]
MHIATLIAAERLSAGELSEALDRLAAAGIPVGPVDSFDPDRACDIQLPGGPAGVRTALDGAIAGIDVVVQLADGRAKRLLVADMDSTMITVECIDELADYAGLKAEVAAVTERAMRGELDFAEALKARVALLADMPVETLDRCRRERVRLMPGARTLVGTMRAAGGRAVLVSGGFTAFADPVAAEIGFDRAVANRLQVADGRLTGEVDQPIVDAATKTSVLQQEAAAMALAREQVMAVGDGANDVPMLQAAGLGIAYHAKPVAEAGAAAAIRYGDLTALLHAQGIRRDRWIDVTH